MDDTPQRKRSSSVPYLSEPTPRRGSLGSGDATTERDGDGVQIPDFNANRIAIQAKHTSFDQDNASVSVYKERFEALRAAYESRIHSLAAKVLILPEFLDLHIPLFMLA